MTKRLEQMLRVDHAGEHGAVKIYEGQAAVFKNSKKTAAAFGARNGRTGTRAYGPFDAVLIERKKFAHPIGTHLGYGRFCLRGRNGADGRKSRNGLHRRR